MFCIQAAINKELVLLLISQPLTEMYEEKATPD